MADQDDFDQVRRLLKKQLGVELPADCTPETFSHDLGVVLQQIAAMKGADDDEYDAPPIQFSTDDDPETARAIVDAQLSRRGGVGGHYSQRA